MKEQEHSMSARSVLIFAVFVVATILIASCEGPTSKKPLDERTLSEQVERTTAQHFQEVFESYRSKNYVKHAELTTALLKYHAQHPLAILYDSYSLLLSRMVEDSASPYLSFMLELAHRSAYAPTPRSNQIIRQLQPLIKKHYPFGSNRSDRSIVIVRTLGRRAYRPYSANAGWIALTLMMSEYDGTRFRSNFSTESYVRIGGFVSMCGQRLGKSRDPGADRLKYPRCTALLEAVAKNLQDETGGTTIADITSKIGGGLITGCPSCVEAIAGSVTQDIIDGFDQYRSCKEGEKASGPPRFDPLGSFFEGGINDYYSAAVGADTMDALVTTLEAAGLERVGHEMNVVESPSGNDWVMWTNDTWINDAGETTTIRWQQDENGNNHYQVSTAHSGGGVSYVDYTNGTPTSAGYNDPNTGESYRAEFNDNGTLKSETFTDSSGTEHVVGYDESGGCTSNCDYAPSASTTTSQPPDDFVTSECAQARVGQLIARQKRQTAVTKLDTLIIPAPDSIITTTNSCFARIAEAGTTINRLPECRLPMLCLAGTEFDQDCTCGGGALTPNLPFATSVCAKITCPEGYQCDPATGTCRSGSDFDLGSISPLPKPVLRKITSIAISAGKDNMPSLIRSFGTGRPNR